MWFIKCSQFKLKKEYLLLIITILLRDVLINEIGLNCLIIDLVKLKFHIYIEMQKSCLCFECYQFKLKGFKMTISTHLIKVIQVPLVSPWLPQLGECKLGQCNAGTMVGRSNHSLTCSPDHWKQCVIIHDVRNIKKLQYLFLYDR